MLLENGTFTSFDLSFQSICVDFKTPKGVELIKKVDIRTLKSHIKKLKPNFIKAWITESKKYDILGNHSQKH